MKEYMQNIRCCKRLNDETCCQWNNWLRHRIHSEMLDQWKWLRKWWCKIRKNKLKWMPNESWLHANKVTCNLNHLRVPIPPLISPVLSGEKKNKFEKKNDSSASLLMSQAEHQRPPPTATPKWILKCHEGSIFLWRWQFLIPPELKKKKNGRKEFAYSSVCTDLISWKPRENQHVFFFTSRWKFEIWFGESRSIPNRER